MRIVVADDDPQMRSLVRLMLRGSRLHMREAASGWELLHLLSHEGPFDLVITDLRMPAPSGLQVIAMARSAGLATPFLLITAFPDDAVRAAVGRLDKVTLLPKPFSGGELVSVVPVAAGRMSRP